MAVALIYSRGKNTQALIDQLLAIKKQVDDNGKAVNDFEDRSVTRFTENKNRFEKGFETLSGEIGKINDTGGVAVSLRITRLSEQVSDHNARIHALEVGLPEIKVISVNIAWIKESLGNVNTRLDRMEDARMDTKSATT